MGNPKKDNILNVRVPFDAIAIRQSKEANTKEIVGDGFCRVKHSYTSFVADEDLRKGALLLVSKSRAVIYESQVRVQDWVNAERLLPKSWV